ncbi:hypothetical protein PoB_001337400 [Plakobranchus ocellatus]|uniref:Uncharacterized protein n=1 Tax=Plakobranchus ocellatus TaxID=259542 RepID=A0AAV3YXR9_9GAST|nr:hypothetical protein PoB_001337400 [Plakobranchus ocellatus]
MEIRQELPDGTDNIMQTKDCGKSEGFCHLRWGFKAERDMGGVHSIVSFTCFAFDDAGRSEARHTYNFALVESDDDDDVDIIQ